MHIMLKMAAWAAITHRLQLVILSYFSYIENNYPCINGFTFKIINRSTIATELTNPRQKQFPAAFYANEKLRLWFVKVTVFYFFFQHYSLSSRWYPQKRIAE
jgi:hypothetical protein